MKNSPAPSWAHAADSGRCIHAKAFVELGKLAEAWGWIEDIRRVARIEVDIYYGPENLNGLIIKDPLYRIRPWNSRRRRRTRTVTALKCIERASARTTKGTYSRSRLARRCGGRRRVVFAGPGKLQSVRVGDGPRYVYAVPA